MNNLSTISRLDTQLAAQTRTAPTATYRPAFYRLHAPADHARLEQLLAHQPDLQVFDQLSLQLAELIKSRCPARKYPRAELQQALQQHLAGGRPTAYGVWVHYPWANRLVHLLDEAEFVELRTNRNQHKIRPVEQARLARQKIGIVGLSVGQAIALTLAMERSCGEFRLADFDTLELSNLNRIRTGVHNLGVSKVVIAAREIAEIDPFLTVHCYEEGVTAATVDAFLTADGTLDLVVDECDSLDIKVLLRQRARAHRIPVVMATSDRGLFDVERFDREPTRPLFHGLVGDLDYQTLQGLSTEGKIPYILRIIGSDSISPQLKASFVEVEQSIVTWPQLGSAVALGGAMGADICRRIALGQYQESGRYFADLATIIADHLPADRERPVPRPAGPSITDQVMIGLIQATLDQAPHACAAPSRGQIAALIDAAILAPSGGNTQPWQWAGADGHLFLFHDRCRSASALDGGRGGLVALGAAIENVVIQAHALGLEVALHYFPLPQEPGLVAAFCFAAAPALRADTAYESHSYDGLVGVLAQRRTNRNLGPRIRLDPATLGALVGAVASVAGAGLHVLEAEADLERIGALIGAGDRLRFLHPRFHQDMMEELRWTPEEVAQTGDGLDLATLPLSAVDRAGLEMCRDPAAMRLLREWNAGSRLKTMSEKAVAAAGAVALLTMPGDQPIDYLLGGRAMQRAGLVATERQVAFQPLTTLPYMFKQVLHDVDGDPSLAAAMSPAMMAELVDLQRQYQGLFRVPEGAGEILLFRLALTDPPRVRERRRPVQDVFRWLPVRHQPRLLNGSTPMLK